MEHINLTVVLIEIIVAIGIAILYIRSRLPKETIQNYKDLVESQEKRIDELAYQHLENEKRIAKLEGQIEVYKDLPLAQIAQAMDNIMHNQKEIIKILKAKS